jgi:hypothetical protein
MSAVKIKIVNTGLQVHVSVDGKSAYITGNSAYVEEDRIKKLLNLLGIENVETEVKFLFDEVNKDA